MDCMKGILSHDDEFILNNSDYNLDIHDFIVACASYELQGSQFDDSAKDQSMLNFAINNIAEEFFSGYMWMRFITDDVQRFVILLPLSQEEDEAFPQTALKFIQLCRELLGIQLKIGASRLLKSVSELSEGYSAAMAALENSSSSKYHFTSHTGLEKIQASYPKTIQTALDYIHEHYSEDISLKSVSNLVFLNAWYFSDLFKKEVGSTFTDYVLGLRIKRAKELLTDRNFSIYQISGMVGINAHSYFSQVFKRATGVSPKEYRKSITGKGG
jgi:AraC-like DNA-binding protein